MSRRERKAYNKGLIEGYAEGYTRGRSEGEVTAAFLQLKNENRINNDRPIVIETDEMVCKEMPDKVAMCFNCNLKTDTCQEGLHCPKDYEE